MSYFELHRPPRRGGPTIAMMVLVVVAGAVVGLAIQNWRRAGEGFAARGDLQVAEQEFRAGDDPAALALFRRLADHKDPRAQYWLGHMTELGLGVPRNAGRAIDLYQASAAENYVPAEVRLGEIYLHGDLVPPDFPEARGYLARAANVGNARAALLLGQMYRLGLGAPADSRQACTWLEVSAIEGNALARQERDALMPTLSAADQHAVSAQAKVLLADISRAAKPATKAKSAGPHLS